MNDNAKKDNRGYLYPNSNKNKPTQPDFTGKVMVEGKEWRISAWENKSPDGKKYLSLSFSPPLPANQNGNGQGNNNSNSSNSGNNSSQAMTGAPISDDLDLDAILNSSDDDNPFN